MDKRTFVCETIKEVLVEMTKIDYVWMIKDEDNTSKVVDNLAKTLCEKYDKYLIRK